MADDSDRAEPDDAEALAADKSESGIAGVPDPLAEDEVSQIVAEEEDAARRRSTIEAGRRKGGVAGAAMAGAMLAIGEIVEGPKKDEMVAVSETPDEPDDIDLDGINVSLDGRAYWAPPPHDPRAG